MNINTILDANTEIKTQYDELLTAMNDMRSILKAQPFDKNAFTIINVIVKEKINAFNKNVRDMAFEYWYYLSNDGKNPVKEALMDGYVPVATVKASETKKECSLEVSNKRFNLYDFIEYGKVNGFDSPVHANFEQALENARKAVSGYWTIEFKSDGVRSKFLAEFDQSTEYKCGVESLEDRYTKGNIDRCLQTLMDAIVYEDKTNGGKNAYVVRKEVRNKVLATFTDLGKSIASTQFPNAKKFADIITSMYAGILQNVDGEIIIKK